MIMTVAEARQFVTTSDSDQVLEAKLQALELLIRSYTHNNFQNRNKRFESRIVDGRLQGSIPYIIAGDTIQISESKFNDGIYVMADDLQLNDEDHVLVTKIEYPIDVKMGVANMLKWQNENGDKVGVQSETISRHSVTYFDMSADNSIIGYPKSLVGFLKPYMRARF